MKSEKSAGFHSNQRTFRPFISHITIILVIVCILDDFNIHVCFPSSSFISDFIKSSSFYFLNQNVKHPSSYKEQSLCSLLTQNPPH